MTNNKTTSKSGPLAKLQQGFTFIEVMIVAAIVAIIAAIGIGAYQDRPLSDEKIERMKDDIVNPDISARSLAAKGFYSQSSSGKYLDACRREVREQFKDKSNKRHAEAIVDCVLAKKSNEPQAPVYYYSR